MGNEKTPLHSRPGLYLLRRYIRRYQVKNVLILIILALVFSSCHTGIKGQMKGDWEVLVSGDWGHSALYRYVDKQYGIIIYAGDNYRMTSQPIQKQEAK
jgi:hypothetical protein